MLGFFLQCHKWLCFFSSTQKSAALYIWSQEEKGRARGEETPEDPGGTQSFVWFGFQHIVRKM